MSTIARTGARTAGDRLNPILVKEVRQALRGRYFKVMFWLTLAFSTLAGLVMVAGAASDSDDLEDLGPAFFMLMFGCLSAAVHGFTPFSAFLSTSAEWDENTHDLLVLSDLRPRQIVLGKLLSALVQGLLYYSTFGPFLVFAFLLNGVDLLSISVILAGSLATCIGLSLAGIALASMARVKAARGLLMALFGGCLVLAWAASIGLAGGIVDSPQILRDPEGQLAVTFYFSSVLLVGGLFGAIAAARFAHDEENHTSGLRILSLGIVLVAGLWGMWMHARFSTHEPVWVMQLAAAIVLYLLWTFFLTERDTLGRRAARHVSPRPWRAVLAAPFLPGGGLGVLLLLAHGALALGLAGLSLALRAETAENVRRTLFEVLAIYGYVLVFVAIPAGLASFRKPTPRGRAVVRLAIVAVVPLAVAMPMLLGLLVGDDDLMDGEHPLNAIWVLFELDQPGLDAEAAASLVLVALLAAFSLVLNARRVADGVREVLAASRARRERG